MTISRIRQVLVNFDILQDLASKYRLKNVNLASLRELFVSKEIIDADTGNFLLIAGKEFDNCNIIARTISFAGRDQNQKLAGIFLMYMLDAHFAPKRLDILPSRSSCLSKHYRKWFGDNIGFVKRILCLENNYTYDYAAVKTFFDTYLMAENGVPVECPQMLFVRVAYTIACSFSKSDRLKEKPVEVDARLLEEVYLDLSEKYYIHATPTLINAGSVRSQQYASCFLLDAGRSFSEFVAVLPKIGEISVNKGGIGLFIGKLAAKPTLFNSCMNMLENLSAGISNETVDVARPTAISIWLPAWHGLVENFLDARNPISESVSNGGFYTTRLFNGIFLQDLFMKRLIAEIGEENCSDERLKKIASENSASTKWSLFCPEECPSLVDLYGEEFEREYLRLEHEHRYCKQVSCIDLAKRLVHSQQRSGTPYTTFSDTVNMMSNQKNIGPILTSNLCTEIFEVCKFGEEIGVCNLASLNLKAFVKRRPTSPSPQNDFDVCHRFDFELFQEKAAQLVCNLNKIIDNTVYMHDEAECSNLKNRPIGIGVQGLQNVFHMLNVKFGGFEAKALDFNIAERLLYACIEKGVDLAAKSGKPYSSFAGSPLSKGIMHFEMHRDPLFFEQLVRDYYWPGKSETIYENFLDFGRKWGALRLRVMEYGVSNSLFVAYMPTATTSMLMGNYESIEPMTSPCFVKSVSKDWMYLWSSELLETMHDLGICDENVFDRILREGSVLNIAEIPSEIREVFRGAFDIDAAEIAHHAAIRAPFIDQGQSVNLFFGVSNTSAHHQFTDSTTTITSRLILKTLIGSWVNGVKNGSYYTRCQNPLQGEEVSALSGGGGAACNVSAESRNCVGCSA